jgi:spermidine synthase
VIPALALAFLSGAIALSYEILWYRAFSFASGGRADTFGLMLGAYLVGLALGSLAVGRLCRDGEAPRAGLTGRLFALTLVANVLGYVVVPLLSWMLMRGLSWQLGLVLVAFAAAFLGAVFPLITHAWIAPDEKVGRNVSYIYLANILGSTSGSLGTGFLLMDHLPLAGMHVLLFFLGLGMAAILLALSPRRPVPAAAALAVLGGLAAAFGTVPFDGVYEKLQDKTVYSPARRFAHVVETRSGVITVNEQGQIFGGGIYDGAFNTSLSDDRNLIIRCYALAEIHRAPKDVLMIGLSSGSWGSVIAANPAVERLTIVEINDGYLRVLPKYPDVAGLPASPKVSIEIDDGRRWMVRNPDRKFDMIVANATFHWRSNASNLLSKEFLELVRSRLKPGGLYAYNTTGSTRAIQTGCAVFPHALRMGGVLVVSDSPLELDVDRLGERLTAYPRGEGVVFDRAKPADLALRQSVLAKFRAIVHLRDSLTAMPPAGPLITDDNMGTEWERDPKVFQ